VIEEKKSQVQKELIGEQLQKDQDITRRNLKINN
jgi:hypothetical protein